MPAIVRPTLTEANPVWLTEFWPYGRLKAGLVGPQRGVAAGPRFCVVVAMSKRWDDRAGIQGSGAWEASSLGRLAARYPKGSLFLGALLLAAFSTAWILLQSPNFLSGYDFERMHFFYKSYFREALLAGRVPLWNPYVGLGRPFLADIETQALYPPNLLVVPFGVRGGVALSLLLHQAVAIYFGVRFARALGASGLPALLAGAGMALASPFTARLAAGMVPVYFCLCWWPALLCLGLCLQDRWSSTTAAAFAAVTALSITAGNPPILFVEMFGLFVVLVFRQEWPRGASGWRAWSRNHGGLALAAILGASLAAAQLLPFAELVGQGNRPLHSTGFAVANGMPIGGWISLVFPASTAFSPNWEFDIYCGLVPLFAAAGAIVLWPERNVRAMLGLGIAGALLAAGDRTPFLGWVVHVVPGASALRIPSRYAIWCATALLGLAAIALSRRPTRPWLTACAVLGLGTAALVLLKPHVAGAAGHGGRFYALHVGGLALAALVVLLWNGRGRWPRAAGVIGCALGAACIADWAWAIHLQAPVNSVSGFRDDEGAVRRALAARGLPVPGQAPPRVSFVPRHIPENSGMVQGFGAYTGYVNPFLDRVWNYLHVAAGVSRSTVDYIQLPMAVYEATPRLDSLNLVARVDDARNTVVILGAPDPRAYVAFRDEVVPDWGAAERLMTRRRDFHSVALVESGARPDFIPLAGVHTGVATIAGFGPERVVVRTLCDAPGILILGEAWYPGWVATVNGVPADVFPVNGWMRGVVVPAGASEAVFTFQSRLVGTGLWVSAASAVLVALLAFGAWPRQTDSRIL